jgi:hypothetical protein
VLCVCYLEFADLDAAGAGALIAQSLEYEPFRYVTTPNADHLVRLHRHPELLPLYQGAMAVARFARGCIGGAAYGTEGASCGNRK